MKKYLTLFLLALAIAGKAQIPATLNNAQKVYGLSKFWQEVNYNFVYLDKVDRHAWDSLYVAMINTVQQTKNDYEYFHEMQRFCAFLKDGHTNVYMPDEIQSKYIMNTMFGKYRLMFTNINGKTIIAHTNPEVKDELPTGTEVIEVNGMPTKVYADKYVRPYFSSSTDYVLDDRCADNLLAGLNGTAYDVKFKLPKGEVKSLHLVHERMTNLTLYPAITDKPLLELKWYPNDIAYLALNSFQDQKIDSIFLTKLPELYKAKGLIIDLRYNGGGSTGIGYYILDYLTDSKVLSGSKTVTRVHAGAYKAWGAFDKPADTVKNEEETRNYLDFLDRRYMVLGVGSHQNYVAAKKIVVPTVILIGHNTASAAEDFLIGADGQSHMIKMGQNSFGSTGQPFQFKLPGGGEARVCTKKDTYPDGREFVGYGIKPDIAVNPTVDDFIKDNDPAVKRALVYLKEKK